MGICVGSRVWIGVDCLLANCLGCPLPDGDDRLQGFSPVERRGRVEGVGVAELDSPGRQRHRCAQLRRQVKPGVLDQAAQVVDVVLALA